MIKIIKIIILITNKILKLDLFHNNNIKITKINLTTNNIKVCLLIITKIPIKIKIFI